MCEKKSIEITSELSNPRSLFFTNNTQTLNSSDCIQT